MTLCGTRELPFRASGRAAMGFRRAGRSPHHRQDRTKSAADPFGCQLLGSKRLLPGQAQVADDRAGQAQLGIASRHGPGEPVGLLGVPHSWGGPAKRLLTEADGVLNGLIASDKFCLTRHGQLRLDWWRRPLRKREPGGCTPPSETSVAGRGCHAAHLRGPAGDQRATGRAGAVGSGLPAGVGVGGGSSTARGD